MTDVVSIIREEWDREERGLTRRELADRLGLNQTRNIPGVRRAIADGLVRYDGTAESRLVPVLETEAS